MQLKDRGRSPNQLIAEDVVLGKFTQIYDFVNLYGCEIGDHSKIGTFVEIQRGAKVGSRWPFWLMPGYFGH